MTQRVRRDVLACSEEQRSLAVAGSRAVWLAHDRHGRQSIGGFYLIAPLDADLVATGVPKAIV
jgi:hypothetical protein